MRFIPALSIIESIFGVWLFSCAPSPLVQKDDQTFRNAEKQFRKSFSLVESDTLNDTGKLSADKILFLQAEGFYHYRLELQPPGTRSLAAQTLAATLDFGPLNMWATTSDLDQLRMQTYNGAVQLYEQLLNDYPNTKTKSLVLYRLGWAYRSISISGFPRNSDSVLTELSNDYPTSPLATFATEIKKIPYKTQEKGEMWSIIPGGGQVYLGEVGSGALRFTLAMGFSAMGIIPPILMVKNRQVDWYGAAISFLGFVGLQVTYTTSYLDAQKGALEFNESEESEFINRHPEAP